ncbi:hypothetical protein NC651_002189 [Populus alba x Populus x berolinensis]|nr:hypothetical protein NC651_002189 [Populus alba x Populus x berolinensis]
MAAISFFPPGQMFSLQTSEFILRLFINSSLPLSLFFHHQRHPL